MINIKQAIDIAVKNSGRDILDIFSIHFISQSSIEELIKMFNEREDCKIKHPYTLLPRIESHWEISFKAENWKESKIRFDSSTSYSKTEGPFDHFMVYLDGECIKDNVSEIDMTKLKKPRKSILQKIIGIKK